MEAVWTQLALVAVLVILNGLFAGSELAMISLRHAQIESLEERGATGRAVARLTREPNRLLATIQIGITLAAMLASATAAVTLSEPVAEWLEPLGRFARPVALLLVTLGIAFLSLVFGELAPKRLALQRPEAWSLVAARPVEIMATISRPLVWLLGVSTNIVVRLLGGDPNLVRHDVSEEEVRYLVSTHRALTLEQRDIVSGTFESATLSVRDVMVPRRRVTGLAADLPIADGVRLLLDSTHSRAPVYTGSLDEATGVVHLKDLVGGHGTVGDCASTILALPDTVLVLDALRQMQRERQHLAVVVDEYGGVDGIVTLEDLLEELVGEIYDEFDRDMLDLEWQEDGSLIVRGSFGIHDLDEAEIELPDGDYSTVAGLVLDELGRMAVAGDQIEAGEWTIEVLGVTGTTVERLRLARTRPDTGDDEDLAV
ncbi:MAG: HlyC/CorC family transporter [Acidimicrobiia bacterium]|nr:HlyC/CorC family transporter [Acidimicrobiia bacterium]